MIALTATQRLARRKRLAVHFNPCHDEQGRFCSGGGVSGLFQNKTLKLLAESENLEQTLRNMDPNSPYGDPLLFVMAKEKGYDGKPTVILKEKMDKIQEAGGEIFYRGLNFENHAAQFQKGTYFAGVGVSGNGSYATKDLNDASRYGDFVLKFSVSKNAKIVSEQKLWDNRKVLQDDLHNNWIKYVKENGSKMAYLVQRVISDEGRAAIILGYDGFRVGRGTTVILNRKKVIVQKELLRFRPGEEMKVYSGTSPEFSRRMAKLMDTKTIRDLSLSQRHALIRKIRNSSSIRDLSDLNKEIINKAENELLTLNNFQSITTYADPKLRPLDRYPSIHVRVQRADPTKTTVLRDAFERAIRVRFNKLKAAIRTAVVDQDVFGLVQDSSIVGRLVTQAELDVPSHRAFDFPTTQAKKEAFLRWLRKQEELGVLETMRIPQFGQATEAAWTDVFVKDSYARGVQRARYEMGKAGYPVPALEGTGGIVGSMSLPFHSERLGQVYGRAFDGLKGITSAMDMQISHILAQGLADGDNPIPLAKKLLAVIDGKGATEFGIFDSLGRFIPAERRARMLARTEIIRAHAHGTLAEAEMWNVAGVTAEVEFVNAGFNVCPICIGFQGKVYTITEARNVIPVHPHCRCAWIIVPVEKK